MKVSSNLKAEHFLSILPLRQMKNAEEIDPLDVLNEIFEFGEKEDLKAMLKSYCMAALSAGYVWKEGPPGNLLFCAQVFEQLVEVAYLKKGEQQFAQFFEANDLPNWKQLMSNLTEAGLGDQSIENAQEPLIFFIEMGELIEAAHLLLNQMHDRQ